jgi:hypothetical protein
MPDVHTPGVDAILTLNEEAAGEFAVETKHRFTFDYLAEQIVYRQKHGKDTIIVVAGERRAGKSNWQLKALRAYIKKRHAADPNFTWSWKKNFPGSRKEAYDYVTGPDIEGFLAFDEGGDEFYTQETLKRAQRELIKIMNKCGSKCHLMIIVWPDIYTLDKKVVNMAHILVFVPYRFEDVCSFAFAYGRNANPLTYDKFGIEKIRKRLEGSGKSGLNTFMPNMDGTITVKMKPQRIAEMLKNDTKAKQIGKDTIAVPYPRHLFKFLWSLPTFMLMHRYGPVDKRFEDAYIKNVKDPNMDKKKDDDNMVPSMVYNRLKNQYETLLYNLYVKDAKSFAQLERLSISPETGDHLKSIEGIKRAIESVKAKM